MRGMAGGGRSGTLLAAASLCAFAAQGQAPNQNTEAPRPYGRIERALVLGQSPIQIESQLEGGGATVLHATDIKYASGEGGMYAHFTIDSGSAVPGRTVTLRLPVLKDQLVHDRDGGVAHHPIVAMNFCIGSIAFGSDVTLEPRTDFTPPLVLGKADAARFAPIDPRAKHTRDPDCQAPPAAAPLISR